MHIKEQLARYAAEHLQKAPAGAYICPLCGSGTGPNRTAAFHVKGERWTCFACGEKGDLVDLIRKTKGCTEREAFQKAEEFAGTNAAPETRYREEDKKMSKIDNTAFLKKCQDHLPSATRAIEYAARRGIELTDLKEWGWGADPDRYDAIVIPKDNGSYEERAVTDLCASHYKAPGQPDSLLWADALYNPNNQDVFIVEAAFDAASIRKLGYQAVALCSTQNFPLLISQLKEKPTTNTLIIAMDGDEMGVNAVKRNKDHLVATGAKIYIAEDIWGDYKDASELAVKDPDQLIDRLIKAQFDAMAGLEQAREAYVQDGAALGYVDLFLENIKGGKYVPISSGFPNLDNVLGGGIRPYLYVIGAAPSFGKTTWTLELADQLAAAGTDVLYFSLEMSRDEVIAKSVSRHSHDLCEDLTLALSTDEITNAEGYYFFSDGRKKLLGDSVDKYRSHARHNFIFEGRWAATPQQIREKVERHIKIMERRPVVIVDYLQMIPCDTYVNDKKAIDDAVQTLKEISRDLEVPVIVISAFNRSGYVKATMSAFKESGAIEYTADVLLGLEPKHEDLDDKGKPAEFDLVEFKRKPEWDMNLQVLKNRNGQTGTVRFRFLPKCSKFIPVE